MGMTVSVPSPVGRAPLAVSTNRRIIVLGCTVGDGPAPGSREAIEEREYGWVGSGTSGGDKLDMWNEVGE